MSFLRILLLLAAALLAVACAPTRPDLTRLYENTEDDPKLVKRADVSRLADSPARDLRDAGFAFEGI